MQQQIGWSEKANLLWQISKQLDRIIKLSSQELLLNVPQIISIINSITGVNDVTYISALNTIVAQQGGVVGTNIQDLLNQLYILLGGIDVYTTRLSILNAIIELLGGNTQTTELNAWIQLGTLLNPPYGYEILRDSDGLIIRDSENKIIYTLKD